MTRYTRLHFPRFYFSTVTIISHLKTNIYLDGYGMLIVQFDDVVFIEVDMKVLGINISTKCALESILINLKRPAFE